MEAEVVIEIDWLVRVTLAQQGPNRFRRRLAQQRCVLQGQRMGHAPCATGNCIAIEGGQQKPSVLAEPGPRHGLVGQSKPRQTLPGGEIPRLFPEDDAYAVAQVRHPALTQFRRLRPYQGDERAPILEYCDLGYFRRTAIASLQILGDHLLAAAQHEDLFHPPGDEEETVAID